MIPYQYLLNYHTNYTITNLANHLENISHDTINRYLKIENFDHQELGRNVKEEIVANTEYSLYKSARNYYSQD
ncbi:MULTISPECIES: hypothetical protein [unclassified Okeania]|uniref:hypothetical protein n=1 Tax=unclassified Okeania TaxID=2634635 RepID=UPI0013B5C3D5|nr:MULTISPECIES: hypothetical protein [unclassified Okeania]NET15133.1 hypothetical protein [Okeania sp. SIO1H6]NET19302.1 hypothetical protein [Okeania sp. SIO1H5]NET92897.1 hypothetical protein [Okeania sp. SIO1H2]